MQKLSQEPTSRLQLSPSSVTSGAADSALFRLEFEIEFHFVGNTNAELAWTFDAEGAQLNDACSSDAISLSVIRDGEVHGKWARHASQRQLAGNRTLCVAASGQIRTRYLVADKLQFGRGVVVEREDLLPQMLIPERHACSECLRVDSSVNIF